jgi:hypothetical protein
LEDLLSFCNILSVTTNLLQRGTFLSFMFHKNGQNSLPVAIALAQAAQSLSFALKRFGEERTGHTRNHPGWHMPQTAVFALSSLNRSRHAVTTDSLRVRRYGFRACCSSAQMVCLQSDP